MRCVVVAWVGALKQVWLRPNVVSAVVEGPDIDDGDLSVEEQAKAVPGCRVIGCCTPAISTQTHRHVRIHKCDFRLLHLYKRANTHTSNCKLILFKNVSMVNGWCHDTSVHIVVASLAHSDRTPKSLRTATEYRRVASRQAQHNPGANQYS